MSEVKPWRTGVDALHRNPKTDRFCPLCEAPFEGESARPPYLSNTAVRVADMTLRDAWEVIKKAGGMSIAFYFLLLLAEIFFRFVPKVTPSFTLIDWPVSLPWWAKSWALWTFCVLGLFYCRLFTNIGLLLVVLGEMWLWASVTRRILWVLVPPIVALFLYHSYLSFILTLLVLIPCWATWHAIDEWKQREQGRRDG
jgi:hypothetical protein